MIVPPEVRNWPLRWCPGSLKGMISFVLRRIYIARVVRLLFLHDRPSDDQELSRQLDPPFGFDPGFFGPPLQLIGVMFDPGSVADGGDEGRLV